MIPWSCLPLFLPQHPGLAPPRVFSSSTDSFGVAISLVVIPRYMRLALPGHGPFRRFSHRVLTVLCVQEPPVPLSHAFGSDSWSVFSTSLHISIVILPFQVVSPNSHPLHSYIPPLSCGRSSPLPSLSEPCIVSSFLVPIAKVPISCLIWLRYKLPWSPTIPSRD